MVAVTRPGFVLLIVILLLLFALPLGIGMAMGTGCPGCHLPGSGLLDGCLLGLAVVSILLTLRTAWSRIQMGSERPRLCGLLLGLDRPPRSLAAA